MMSSAFEKADQLVDEVCELSPLFATSIGAPGHDHEWGDLGLAGVEARSALRERYQDAFADYVDDPDFLQRLAARVTLGALEEQSGSHEADDHLRDLSHMACTFHQIRSVFDVMPSETADDWDNITARLETIDGAFSGYIERLDEGRRRGITAARRQAESVASQADALSGGTSSFLLLLEKASQAGQRSERLEDAVSSARAEAARFAAWLRETYLPDTVEEDAVGEERYRRSADRLVGLPVDPDEAYEWGWAELHRLIGEMEAVGARIVPGAGFEEVKLFLEKDPETTAGSREDLVEFVTELLSKAVDDLAGAHFDLPEAIRPITVQIAPPGGPLGVYYMGPSEDFSRPGGVWYSIGDQTSFPLYQHVSTAYHEGFPGHHLQIATARQRKDTLSRAHRLLTWYPGYSEGWAMYAEVLMGELGYLDDPKHYFGMLAKQTYRAARVVVDIGLHLEKPISNSSPLAPGESWEFGVAAEFMRIYGFRTAAQAEAEVLRYLGWPGQAIAYKLGEREILSIREEARNRLGAEFDLARFHASVLNHGTMRLDLLRDVAAELMGDDTSFP